MKTKFRTLWCMAKEMMDFFQERERFGLTALEALSAENPKLLTGIRLLSCCQDEDEDKILDSSVSGEGDDGLFEERERFGLTALEALSAEESQVIIRKKVIKLLSKRR